MKQLRCKNKLLLIDIDCLTKEIDLLQTRGTMTLPESFCLVCVCVCVGGVGGRIAEYALAMSLTKTCLLTSIADVGSCTVKAAPEQEDDEGAQWSCTTCTFLNHPALNRCEKCDFPRHS